MVSWKQVVDEKNLKSIGPRGKIIITIYYLHWLKFVLFIFLLFVVVVVVVAAAVFVVSRFVLHEVY